jgi:hypothetical protein
VERYLRDKALALVPLHYNQHAYQARKSVKTALHQLVVRVEEALDQQETASGVFLDIGGTFKNTCNDTMCDALIKHTIVRWIRATLEGRVPVKALGDRPLESRLPRAARWEDCCHHFCGAW